MAKKKQNGGVYYEANRKRWKVMYYYVDPETLETKVKNKIFHTEKEANDYYSSLQYQRGNSLFVEHNGIPFNLLLRGILEKKSESGIISERSYRRIDMTIKILERNEIMHKNVDEITSDEIQMFLNSVKDYSQNSISKLMIQLNQGFRLALNKGYIKSNPMFDVITPKSTKPPQVIRALDLEEQQKLTSYLLSVPIYDEYYRNVFLIQMFCGLRIGEALALKTSDINLVKKTLTVERTLTRDKKDRVIMGNTTKTYAGRREIPIPDFLMESIKMQMLEAKEHKEKLLFVDTENGYANTCNVNKELHKIIKKLGIENISTHSLRHTYGTRCVEAGMRAVALQRLMGHTDVSVTLNTYTTIFNKYKEQELEKVNEYYLNNEIIYKDNLLESGDERE